MRYAITLLACLLNLLSQAQVVQDNFSTKFIKYLTATLLEKVYLQTDKPYYVVEDTIWLKVHAVNAQIHQPSPSNFVYVELIDQQNKVITRVKIKRDSIGFQGYIKPEKTLTPGEYALRAYTNWMKNEPQEYFFQKNITIGRIAQMPRLLSVTYQQVQKGKINAQVKYTHNNGIPITYNRIDFAYNKGDKIHKKRNAMTDKQGMIELDISLNDEPERAEQQLTATIFDGRGGIVEQQYFAIPRANREYDLQFFPESGTLLADALLVAGFKAIGTDGLSTSLTGKVISKGGSILTEFTTEHNGMGKFILKPQRDSIYYAITTNEEGIQRKFKLPDVETEGIILQVIQKGGKYMYSFENRTPYPTDSLYLMAHTRGMLSTVKQLNEQNKHGEITLDKVPEGILNIAIVNLQGTVFCERAIFVKKENRLSPYIDTDSLEYGQRSKVELSLESGSKGDFALSITDGEVLKWDGRDNNIVSQLLMTSELKGYIETPGYYFTNNPNKTDRHLDLLMLTQGWRRYDISAILQDYIPNRSEPLERGQALTGYLRPTFRWNNLKGVEVIGFSKTSKRIQTVKAEGIVIHPDMEKYPQTGLFIPHYYDKGRYIKNELLKTYQDSYKQNDIWREVVLDDVDITAKYITPTGSSAGHLMNEADYVITRQTIKEKYSDKSIADIIEECFIKRYPEIQRIDDDFYYGVNKLYISINNLRPIEHYELRFYNASDIYGIGFIRNGKRTFNSKIQGAKGVLLIDVRGGKYFARNFRPSLGLATLYPLGYQKPVEFYSPKYEVTDSLQNSKTDFRTTVYWNPCIQTDSTGHAKVSFYTTDMKHDMEYVLEGITEGGVPCRTTGRIKARKN